MVHNPVLVLVLLYTRENKVWYIVSSTSNTKKFESSFYGFVMQESKLIFNAIMNDEFRFSIFDHMTEDYT